MATVIVIVASGIQRGIELAVTVMVPAIVVITVGMAIYAVTLEGASEAYAYYLSPEWSVIAVLIVALALGVLEYVEFLTGPFAEWLAAL